MERKTQHPLTNGLLVLPLLSEERYYKKLRYGYARGHEPVQYVNRIREYHDILVRAF
ncbi:MAG: hypothetical protein KTR17_12980 [Cellvibrionaceae bacterium]|nr:hypothetical protein [Cellvibrionaceae bacterium]